MENNVPNKTVSRIFKEWQALKSKGEAPSEAYFKEKDRLKEEANKIFSVVGAVGVMSKNNILKIASLQSSLRFTDHLTFLHRLTSACEDVNGVS